MRCRIRHPSPSARRAYPAGLAGERHDAVQPAAAASDPEEASREDTTIEKRSKLLLDEARHMPLTILLGGQKGFQLTRHDLIEERLFGVARPVRRIGNHEGIAGCNPRRNASGQNINEIREVEGGKIRFLRDNRVALVLTPR